MSDETDNWEWEKTFTYTITSKDVRVQQWEVQSCGKQLTESEVKRICEVENNWELRENRYRYVESVQGADADGVQRSNVNGWHSKNFKIEKDNTPYNEKFNLKIGLVITTKDDF